MRFRKVPIDVYKRQVEESAKGIVNVAEMSTDLTGSVGDIQKAADHNNEIADLLDTEVKRFKLE